jgi:hypothetical protein
VGYYVDADTTVSSASGVVGELIPEREFEPTLGACLHEAAHALHLHSRGYRIARATVGRRNFIERALGEGARMTSLEQIEAALAGGIGASYASCRFVAQIGDDEIDTAVARVATSKHGSCDACIAGFFARHIASFSDTPDNPAVIRAIWRMAEDNVIDLLTTRHAYLAQRSLGERLQNETEMTGESVHQHLEPHIAFGSQPITMEN